MQRDGALGSSSGHDNTTRICPRRFAATHHRNRSRPCAYSVKGQFAAARGTHINQAATSGCPRCGRSACMRPSPISTLIRLSAGGSSCSRRRGQPVLLGARPSRPHIAPGPGAIDCVPASALMRSLSSIGLRYVRFTIRPVYLSKHFVLSDHTVALSVLNWVTFSHSITVYGYIGTDLGTEVGGSTILHMLVALGFHSIFNFGTDLDTWVGTSLRIPAGFRVVDNLTFTSAFWTFDHLGTDFHPVEHPFPTVVDSTLLHTDNINLAIIFRHGRRATGFAGDSGDGRYFFGRHRSDADTDGVVSSEGSRA
ncbi:hypothetical protein A4X13_0g8653 [Tilletia indica]|uniref:Uncharacterized protein n=1 Tax=Tilletia indica TaxID=43049 RepID=A0A177T0E1_9BASI|nr:hypothetical protein A4X13_0g8653 [Tilletia indica]